MLKIFAEILAAVSIALVLASCGVDAGARVGSYGVRAGVGTTAPTYVQTVAPPSQPVVIVNPTTGPALPPPLPPE